MMESEFVARVVGDRMVMAMIKMSRGRNAMRDKARVDVVIVISFTIRVSGSMG